MIRRALIVLAVAVALLLSGSPAEALSPGQIRWTTAREYGYAASRPNHRPVKMYRLVQKKYVATRKCTLYKSSRNGGGRNRKIWCARYVVTYGNPVQVIYSGWRRA